MVSVLLAAAQNRSKVADFHKITAFAFDIDGVFTDGGVLCDLNGELYRSFDAKDGFAVRMAVMNGFPVAIITGGRSGSIRARFLSCGVQADDVFLGSRNKIEDFDLFCAKHGLSRAEVAYVGDDIPDVEVMQICGMGVCPSDAVPEAKEAADFVSDYPGGRGCVRQLIENVMKAHGMWKFDVTHYKKLF